MPFDTPLATLESLVKARTEGNLATALSCYAQGAVAVVEPGTTVSGHAALDEFISATAALDLSFGDRQIIESQDIALHLCAWVLRLGDGTLINGRTSDVLQRQPSGEWLLIIDNPWGTALLD